MVAQLALSDVGVRYGSRRVLSGITTDVMEGGEVVALIGPNAAGKSSLFRRIAGLIPGEGEIRIGGRPGKRPCYLPQDTAVNAVLTVYESLVLACKQDSAWRVSEHELIRVDAALRELEIEELAFRGLAELSGGQRQLVSIAQTLVRDPDILLLDEPTSALDLHRQFEVLSLLVRIARERRLCVLVSLHDINQALRFADRIMVLAGGGLRALGRPRDVVTSDLLREVYGVRVRIEAGETPYIVVEGSARGWLSRRDPAGGGARREGERASSCR